MKDEDRRFTKTFAVGLLAWAVSLAVAVSLSVRAQAPEQEPNVRIEREYQRIVIPEEMEDWYVCREERIGRALKGTSATIVETREVCMEAYRIADPYPDESVVP